MKPTVECLSRIGKSNERPPQRPLVRWGRKREAAQRLEIALPVAEIF